MNVVVAPNLYARAWTGESLTGHTATHWFTQRRTIPLLHVMPVRDALLTRSAPALFSTYAPVGELMFPRLTKAAQIHYRSLPEEASPRLTALAVDIDHENHTPPPDGWHTELLARLTAPFDAPMWYRTPNGLRLVYELAESVSLQYAQAWLAQAYAALRDMGIPTDEGVEDWTRLYRLPDREANLPLDLDPKPPLVWTPPAPLVEEDVLSLGTIADTPKPNSTRTKFTRKELAPLAKAEPRLADAIYNGTLRASEGSRHRVLLAAAIRLANAFETNDPSLIYDYLAPAAERMAKPLDELWRLCQWAAAAHSGLETQVRVERESALLRAAAAMDCLPADVSQRLIIDTGVEQFVWDEEAGRYSSGYGKQHQLLPALDRHCPTLLPEYYMTFTDPIRRHSSPARKLVYSYDPDFAGYDEHTETLYVPVCRPDPSIKARYSAEVQEWLDGTFGLSPHYENLLDWLARAFELRAPVCGLYIQGAAGTGKNLLVHGLARYFSPEAGVVSYAKLLAEFNQPLLESPFILADEKVPTDKRGANESAVLRQHIGNTRFRINAKFKTEATLIGYPRTIVTANNADALRINEDLSEEDLEAIRVRLGYILIPDEAEDFLSKMAERRGYATTREMVDPWVKNGTIAAHALWLRETRKVTEGDRFLVEGWDSELTRNLPANVGVAGTLVSAIVSAVTSGHYYASVRWFGGCVYVSNALLSRDWDDLMRNERMPTNQSRLKALKALAQGRSRTLDLPGIGQRRQKFYWELPGNLIAKLAQERGEADADVVLRELQRPAEPQPGLAGEALAENALKVLASAE